MREFTLVERAEPFTLKEVIDFIDDENTDISKLDAHELKCRIVDVIQAEREKVIDEFAKRLKRDYQAYDIDLCLQDNDHLSYTNSCIALESYVDEIAEQLKGGSDDGFTKRNK